MMHNMDHPDENRDFDVWNRLKKKTHRRDVLLGFKVRELWFIRMGKNIGFEQDGKGEEFLRPVLVFKKFNTQLFWGISLTGRSKNGVYYFRLPTMHGRKNTLILSQLRLYDAKRLQYQIGVCAADVFERVKQHIIAIIHGQEFETPAKAGEARRRLYGKRSK